MYNNGIHNKFQIPSLANGQRHSFESIPRSSSYLPEEDGGDTCLKLGYVFKYHLRLMFGNVGCEYRQRKVRKEKGFK